MGWRVIIHAKSVTGWHEALRAARSTVPVNKQQAEWRGIDGSFRLVYPSIDFIKDMIKAEHSVIRCVQFFVEMIGIPSFVSTHLVRHSVGVQHFVASNREDRSGNDSKEVNRLTPINHSMFINVQALINLSKKRLCRCASQETTDVWFGVKEAIECIDPIVAAHMVPECIYRGGVCHEPKQKCCGLSPHYTEAHD